MGGMEERRTPGNTLIVQPDKPYQVSAAFEACQNSSHLSGPPQSVDPRQRHALPRRIKLSEDVITSHLYTPGLQRDCHLTLLCAGLVTIRQWLSGKV